MLLFGKRKNINFDVKEQNALESSLYQATDLIYNLIDDGESFIALKDGENIIKFRAIKNYLYFVEVPLEHDSGAKEAYFTKSKISNILIDLYNNKKIIDIKGLIFKPYL